jgi:hypothetical protein
MFALFLYCQVSLSDGSPSTVHISHPECLFNLTFCVDYNGYRTNCIKGGGPAWQNFLGSDCFEALVPGHCENEGM